MSNALMIVPKTMGEARTFAEWVSGSAMLQPSLRGKPEDVFAIVLTGMEVGIGPMQALRSINVIQGKPVMDAMLMVALAKANRRCKYFRLVESTEEKAIYETLQEGSPEPERAEYTLEDAKREGLLGKDNWRRMPKQMLRARAASALARLAYQDSVLGIYAREEFGETPREAEVEDAVVEPVAEAPHPTVETAKRVFEGAQETTFPTATPENDERERMLQEEQKEKQANADRLHKIMNEVYPGDSNKALRKDKYAMLGLKMANPIKQFLGLSLEKQNYIIEDAEEWAARVLSDMPPDMGGKK